MLKKALRFLALFLGVVIFVALFSILLDPDLIGFLSEHLRVEIDARQGSTALVADNAEILLFAILLAGALIGSVVTLIYLPLLTALIKIAQEN